MAFSLFFCVLVDEITTIRENKPYEFSGLMLSVDNCSLPFGQSTSGWDCNSFEQFSGKIILEA